MLLKKIIIAGFLTTIIALFFYSFTQVDLGLTMTRVSVWQGIQTWFQHIGYFDRHLSTYLYAGLITLLFLFYFLFIKLTREKKIDVKTIWRLLLLMTVILTFSYNAFSYDLFNYVFDAKIITHYHQNPYEHKALDYPGDPMLGFMHWTQRTLPYGPSWLLVTVPLSVIGSQVFLVTFFLFKIMIVSCFIGTLVMLRKIIRKVAPADEAFALVFFGLNPLVIIESLVSAHNDIVMMFFAITALYYLVQQQTVKATLFYILSIGIKYATAFLLPVFAFVWIQQRKKKTINWERVFLVMTALMSLGVIGATYRTNFQPWYLINMLPFAALIGKKPYIFIPTILLSLASLLLYIPFLYTGNWDKPIPSILDMIMYTGIFLSLLFTGGWYVKKLVVKA